MAVEILGSINVDIIQQVKSLPRPGETILSRSTVRLPGGKGANQAVAAARMGAPTGMIAATGDDEGGAWMLDTLRREGVGMEGIARLAGQATGTAYITVDEAGENQIIVAPGANLSIAPSMITPPAARTRVLLAQLEVPVETIALFFAPERAAGRIRMLNAAPALSQAADLLPLVDIAIVNEHELAHYAGSPAPATPEEAVRSARALMARPDQCIIVTMGALGAVAIWSDRHVHAPALAVSPVDTIGAGDCFVGTLAACLDAGRSVGEALPFANAAAALCTQRQGAIPAMPAKEEVEEVMAREPT